MAGSNLPSSRAWPIGSHIFYRLGGHAIEGFAAGGIVDAVVFDFDFYVRGVWYTYTKTSTNDLDGIVLSTIGSPVLNVVGTQDMSANLVAVKQTLHADIVNVPIDAGNGIKLLADGAGTTEGGIIVAHVAIEPRYKS